MNKKISIHDIAKEFGVSATSISFIINGKQEEKRISKELSSAVLAYIEKIGYAPNPYAKGLKSGKTNTIGLILENIGDAFFSQLAFHLERIAKTQGYTLIHCSTDNNADNGKALLKLFQNRQLDGVIMVPPPGVSKEIMEISRNVPVVLFDRYYPELELSHVVLDNFRASYDAVSHLIQNNYSNIGFVTLDSGQSQMEDRLSGYHSRMQEAGLKSNVLKLGFQSERSHVIRKIVSFILDNPGLDSLLFGTNYLALNGLNALQELKLTIPRDMSVVTFDDQLFWEVFKPSITAIRQPIEEMSQCLMDILLSKINEHSGRRTEQRVVFNPILMERQSSGSTALMPCENF